MEKEIPNKRFYLSIIGILACVITSKVCPDCAGVVVPTIGAIVTGFVAGDTIRKSGEVYKGINPK